MANYRVNLKYNTQRDAEIIQRLEAQENKQDYIRKLILSDIAASALLNLQDDIEHGRTIDRINYWEKHCQAIGDPDFDCAGRCHHHDMVTGRCTLEDEWKKHKAKTHLNSLYGKSVSLPEVNNGKV